MLKKKIMALLLATSVMGTALVGCGQKEAEDNNNQNPGQTTDQTQELDEVNLVYYLWGSEGAVNQDILAEINKKMKEDINATIEVKYIDWGDISTKYPLLFASGEKFDMSHASPTAAVSYFTLAEDDAIVDITDMLDTAAPRLKESIPEDVWAGTKYNGRIYGVPSLYSEFTPYGVAYRLDLLEKYNMDPVASIDDMATFMQNVVDNEDYAPLNGSSAEASNLYKIFTESTGWINAPGIPMDSMYLTASTPEGYDDVFHPAFTDEFADWVVKMREWADKGYWPTDILSSQVAADSNMRVNNGAAYLTHAQNWIGKYGTDEEAGMELGFYTVGEDIQNIKKKPGVDNSTVISSTSDNPERALMAIDLFMNDEEYYNLIQYGLEGRTYVIEEGVKKQPEGFDPEVDGGGFAAWSLRNDKFNLPMSTENPIRSELYEKWNTFAFNDPYIGFSFSSENVASELAAISNVNANLGVQLLLGKTQKDPLEALEDYRNQLKQAGIDDVIAELKAQLGEFTPLD